MRGEPCTCLQHDHRRGEYEEDAREHSLTRPGPGPVSAPYIRESQRSDR
jgi:hypothetical protein